MADSRLSVGAIPLAMMSASCAGSSLQLSSVTVTNGLGPWNSSTGSASASGTPKPVREGPMARRSTCLGPVPVMINPPMPTLAPVCTRIRVERLRACAAGDALGVDVGVGIGVVVGLGVGVTGGGVGVGVPGGVGVEEGEGVGVEEGEGVGVDAVGVGVGVGAIGVEVGVDVGV